MNIRQRIEALKKQVNYDDPNISPVMDMAYNEAIDAVLKEIKDAFAEKDQPDCDGYWWNKDGHAKTLWLACNGQVYCYFHNKLALEHKWHNPKDIDGVWIKAIVPKGDNDE